MIRLVLRFFAYLSLSIAIIAAVLDAARSVGASQLATTSLRESWQSISASSLAFTQGYVEAHMYPALAEPVMSWLLATPTFVVFAVLAFLLYAAGYRRENAAGRFAAR